LKSLKYFPEIGNQVVVSEVLNGKRELSLEQIQKLAKRVDLPISIFIDSVVENDAKNN